jgi:hypothetical protein
MIYRKAKNAKVYFAVNGEEVTRVTIKNKEYFIYRGLNWIVENQATDPFMTVEISKEEFTTAYKIAKTGTDIEVTFI